MAKRLAGLSFLISRLPVEAGADIGVRATPDHLADLLIDDLTLDQGAFRAQVRDLVKKLVDDGHLVQIGDEVRIQTTEGRAWQQEFQKFRAQFGGDVAAIAETRDKMIEEALAKVLRQVNQLHGEAKVPRKLLPHRGDGAPQKDGRNVPLWIRDGWRATEKETREAARTMGSSDGVLHLFIAKPAGNELRDAIADHLAAKATLQKRGVGHGASGDEARRGMETRERVAGELAIDLAEKLVADAQVFLGGGTAQTESSLKEKLDAASDIARKRLFPQFKDADHPALEWAKALKTAREGGEHPFSAVGHVAEADTHAVGKAVLNAIGAGKAGREVRQHFERDPYGWPQDAVDAALVALVRANKLTVVLNGEPAGAAALDGATIGKATFRREEVSISAREKIALAGLMQPLVGPIPNRDELAEPAREFFRQFRKLGENAGGEPPLPAAPRLPLEDEAQALAGNALLRLMLDKRSEIESAIASWRDRAKLKDERLARWRVLERLARHAANLPEAAADVIEVRGVRDGRQLLDPTDPLPAPLSRLRQLLTQKVTAAHQQLGDSVRSALDGLATNPAWTGLEVEQKEAVLAEVSLKAPPAPDTSDDLRLAEALDRRPLDQWRAEIDAAPARQQKAAERVARMAEPEAKPTYVERGATVRTAEDVEAWIGRQRDKLLEAIQRGPVVIS